jgi:hypothetical protein
MKTGMVLLQMLAATPMRNEEKYCAIELQDHLVYQGHVASFKDGSDPPDIEFVVDGKLWAVEHTQLFQYVEQSGEEASRAKIDSINLAVEDRLRAKSEGNRKASWLLALYGLIPSSDLRLIEDAALASILADSTSLFSTVSNHLAELRRVDDSKGRLFVFSMLSPATRVPKSAKVSADIQATIDYAIQNIFKAKAPTLSQLTQYHNRTLLIQSQYMFCDARNVGNAVSKYSLLRNGIDNIFLVRPEGVSQIV